MRNYTVNLFKLHNLSDLDFSYRLVDFQLPLIPGEEDRFNKQLNKIALQVSSASGGPAAIIKRNGRFYVAIPSDRTLDPMTINVVPFNVKVTLLPQVHNVKVNIATQDNIDIIFKFVDFEIRKQLSRFGGSLWKLNSSHFFSKIPVHTQTDSSIQVYEGFVYKLVRLNDGNFYVCLDLSTKYIDKYLLSHYINKDNKSRLQHIYINRKFLYLNGENWYTTELMGFSDTIQKHEFDDDGKSVAVYDYILSHAKGRKGDIEKLLKPEHLAMLYTYPGRNMQPHSGATSLAKMIYSTKDKEVQALHSFSLKDPTRRFTAIEKFIKEYFQNMFFNKTKLNISTSPLIEKISNFAMPELKFNGDTILKVGNPTQGQTALRDFATERKQLILSKGVLSGEFFDEQFLIVPDSFDRKLLEAFQSQAEQLIKKLAPKFPGFKVIRYPAKKGQAATFQTQEIEKVLVKNNATKGFALFILPDLSVESTPFVHSFHDTLKSKFYPDLKMQCASAFRLINFFDAFAAPGNGSLVEYRVPEQKKGKFHSYLVNLVLEHLIVNRKWPYALSKNLHYDIYIGVDVHDRHAGFTFFFRNGENIFFWPVKVPLKNRSQRAEKIKAKTLTDTLTEKLTSLIPLFCPNPNGIVVIRDGKSFVQEHKAIQTALKNLADEKLLDTSTMKYGVLDLHKQSAIPLRIASMTNGHDRLENPIAGAFKPFSSSHGFLYNTGFPFRIRGSSKPLQLILQDGNVEFGKVAEDVFCQTMLAFSAPDLSNSLPVSIKLIDLLLEPLSAAVDQEPSDEDEYEYDDSTDSL